MPIRRFIDSVFRSLPFVLFCMACGLTPPDVEQVFQGKEHPQMHAIPVSEGRIVHAATTGNPTGIPVVMVHGSPGAWNDYAHVMADDRLAEHAFLISVDRPGWGASAEGGLDPSLIRQATALKSVIDELAGGKPVVLVGHSYGGPVVARFAMKHPAMVRALILVGASISPELEEPTWLQKVGRLQIIRPLVPDILRRADEEILPLKPQLETMLPLWHRLTMPVLLLHGEDDSLVPVENVLFAERMSLPRLSVLRIANQGHLIPWQRPELIVEAIMRFL